MYNKPIVLKTGMIVEDNNGKMGLVSIIEGMGTIIGFNNGSVTECRGNVVLSNDERLNTRNIYMIKRASQILGKNITPSKLKLLWEAVPTITSVEELEKLLKEHKINVKIDLK